MPEVQTISSLGITGKIFFPLYQKHSEVHASHL